MSNTEKTDTKPDVKPDAKLEKKPDVKPERKPGLSASTLKFIAMGAMLIDHIGLVLIENGYLASFKDTDVKLSTLPLFWINFAMRTVGKIAFPLYAFLIKKGK